MARGRKRIFTEAQEDAALAMRHAGDHLLEIAERYQVSEPTVYRALRRAQLRFDQRALDERLRAGAKP